MISIIKKHWQFWTDSIKFKLINRWTQDRGLTIVRIVSVTGTDYIQANDGALHAIGGKSKST